MSAATHILRSLIVFSALLGFSAMANAGPHAGHRSSAFSQDYHWATPGYAHGVSRYRVSGSCDRHARPYNRRWSRVWRGVRFGVGPYGTDARGNFGVGRYGLYDGDWDHGLTPRYSPCIGQ